MYGKLVNGELIKAPETMVLEDGKVIENFNRHIDLMKQHGFKPIVTTKPGYDVYTQYCEFKEYVDFYTYIGAQYDVFDIEFSEAEIQNKEAQKAMEMLNMNFNDQIQTLSDEMALEVPSVFPKWEVGVAYEVGFKLRHNDILFKVLQAHISQEDWEPNKAPSLFAQVIVGQVNPETGEQEILEWVQPDNTNPYMFGDKVLFNGIVYESIIDNNVWSPEAYPQGWQIIEE